MKSINLTMITPELIAQAMDYNAYKTLLDELLTQGKTTGSNQSEEFVNFGKINLQRMHRVEKTTVLMPELVKAVAALKDEYVWLVLTEGWCGDASQNLPVIHLVAQAGSNIELKLLLRDEHTDIMDLYLTNGARAIPKLICLKKNTSSDNVTFSEMFVWGPRPTALQEIVVKLKHEGVSLAEKGIITQNWYNHDKTLSVQKELLSLIGTL